MLKHYAQYFVAFILNNLKDVKNIERIVLYGSVAKEEETKESDIDIFIEVKKKNIQFEKEIKNIEQAFYKSREASLFKVKGIENTFSIKIGILKEWKELYASIASTGIILYGPYEAKELPSGVKHMIIIYWDNIEKNRGSFLNKLYGFTANGKTYDGILTKYGGKKVGKSSMLISIAYKQLVFDLLKEHKVSAKTIEVFV